MSFLHRSRFDEDILGREWSNVFNERGLLMCVFLKLYGYYNGLDIEDILATENELREVIEEHGPFDGLLGYS